MDHLPVVELLLKAGVDPNAADKVCWYSRFPVCPCGVGLTDIIVRTVLW
jgi:hypothetical protein